MPTSERSKVAPFGLGFGKEQNKIEEVKAVMKALLTKQKMINKVILIPEYKIKPNPYQPRKVFDEEKIEQLATSIAQYGLLQPITLSLIHI